MISWTKKYSVNVQMIDEQHRQFIKLANKAIEIAQKRGVQKEEVLTIVGEFLDYSLYHLKTEEDYFVEFDCINPEHLVAHAKYRKTVNDLFDQVRAAEGERLSALSQELAMFAGNWLLQHILIMDKGYTKCFNDHGLR